ncbi:MAG TPA: undecaprenyl-diphosphate phosphatase, partial [Lacipirellulaceae bacterium]|nr:undecaprenyl-diphosphate phosphatase [Lacipirellulaceae bacterium]
MPLLEILILAVVQGLTEFLPVSSSGHLVVANALLEAAGRAPAPDLLEVSIVLHLGTLAAVLLFYRREIARLFAADRRAALVPIMATSISMLFAVGALAVDVGHLHAVQNTLQTAADAAAYRDRIL